MAADPKELRKKQERALRVAAKDGGPENLALVQSLLADKVNVDAYGEGFKKTALHLACQHNHPDIVKVLLAAGANPLLEDKDNATPFKLAEQAGHQGILDILISHIPPKKTDNKEVAKEASRENPSTEYTLKEVTPSQISRGSKRLDQLIQYHLSTLSALQNDYLNILVSSVTPALQLQLFGNVRPLPELAPEDTTRLRQEILFYEIITHFILPALNSLASVVQNFEHFKDKSVQAQMITQHAIALCLKFEIQFKDRKEKIEKALNIFAQAKNGHIDRTLVKKIEKLFLQVSDIFLEKTLKPVQTTSLTLMGDPKEYLDFLREYFPDVEALDNLGEKLILAAYKFSKEQQRDEFDFFQNLILDKIEVYFERCQGEIEDCLISGRAKIEEYCLLNKTSEAFPQLSLDARCRRFCEVVKEVNRKHFSDMTQAIRHGLETMDFRAVGVKIAIPSLELVYCYLTGRMTILSVRNYLLEIDKEFKTTIQQKCGALKREFLKTLSLKEPPADWVSARAKEIETQKALNRAQENKRRAENQAQRETSQLRAFNLKQQQRAEEKLQGEMDEISKKMLGSLKEDAESIEVLEGVLGGNTRLKQVAFFKLVKILKIPGSETIPDTNSPPEDNKLTLHHKPRFESFTVHCRHGKDRAEWIHPNAVKCLKELMNKFGIKQDNFRKLLETAVKSQVKASVT